MKIRIITLILLGSLGILAAKKENQINCSPIAQEISHLLSTDQHIKSIQTTKDPYFRSLLTLIDKVQALETIDSFYTRAYKNFFYNTFFGPLIEASFPKGIILLNKTQAPKLHALTAELCTKLSIEKPLIFLTASKKIYNASASSLGIDTSLIVIGQKLINELNEQELRAVLAHELAHVKKSHIPQKLLCTLSLVTATAAFLYWIAQDAPNPHLMRNTQTTPTPQSLTETITTYLNYPSVKVGLLGIFYIAYGFFMMRLSQHQETEADLLAIQTTQDPQGFSGMIETFKSEINEHIRKLEEEYEYVTQHLKNIEETSPTLFTSISSDAQHYYDSMKEHFQDLLDGDGSTHPSLEARQQMAQKMQQSGT